MENEEGSWVVKGLREDGPGCLHTIEELIDYVNQVGFLPLFANEIPGFSVEEHTLRKDWWSGDVLVDPWAWREVAARSGKVIYGKFFDKKTGFISREWFPDFANYRRDGYDFDALYEDGKASMRQKKIMNSFLNDPEAEEYSFELKQKAGFGKGGEKNFEGVITSLQMQGYLCMRDFRQKKNKKGESYGWPIAIYCTPEHLWGYEEISRGYKREPEESKKLVFDHVKAMWPDADDKQIARFMK